MITKFCEAIDRNEISSVNNAYAAAGVDTIDDKGSVEGKIWLSGRWDTRCNPVRPGKLKVNLDQCKLGLSTTLNGCNTDSTAKKWGGQSNQDCVWWNMTKHKP